MILHKDFVYPIIIAVSPFTNYKIAKTTVAKTLFWLTSFYVGPSLLLTNFTM